ncbi:PA2169 family four-helix-bundle protein [Gillisia sp. M10.2A]|uniref:PA2169 family four-helix-bundle protein n=1 Tax=Gillisia lutea TaxID=2909668 RepID=A0ABS9EGY5_9FLAO|nr:PA2169 family four-helix-bundle protein [Gillisia lutea]MCF4101542.1 PA2169 family four-helix-bundle protein [Gillisia lutea]
MKTTREEAKEHSHDDLVHHLQGLLEKNYDAEKGFKKAMVETEDLNLKEFLQRQALQRNRFATQLDKEIHSLNAKPKEKGSAIGALHRAWIDVKTAFTGNDDEAILEECIRGEKASVREYEETLKKQKFPAKITDVLNSQLSEIRTTLSKVKSLEDLADSWD